MFLIATTSCCRANAAETPAVASPARYLADVVTELDIQWPQNRAINIVAHGHSVPAGYFATPVVDTFNAYPHLLHEALKKGHPYAVINVIVTAIGGEQSESGAARFDRDVLTHRPDVVLIDYGLNDRGIGLERARKAWTSMITKAQAQGVKVILLTPPRTWHRNWKTRGIRSASTRRRFVNWRRSITSDWPTALPAC